ncbi:formate transporter FocA [Marinomonas arenicola]|uniref:formate transporter FocA n=1 Tax=Marinomonas arenicola TaxID=569601 RepID=UPI00311EC7C0
MSDRDINLTQSAPTNEKQTTLDKASDYGYEKVRSSFTKSFALAIYAGIFISIAFVFYLSVTTGSGGAPWGIIRLVGGIAFSLGLILVIVCGGELFTSTVLSTVGWAQGRFNTAQLLKCWGRVYLGNFVGTMALLGLVMAAKLYQLDGGEWGIHAMTIAQGKLKYDWSQAFALGILCNFLVCLATWMTFTSKDCIGKSLLVILPVAMFVSSGFEHSIANMFMVPLGLAIKAVSDPAFYIAHGHLASDFSQLTFYNFIVHNLIPVTLGNIFGGGILVGLGYWSIDQKKDDKKELDQAVTAQNR